MEKDWAGIKFKIMREQGEVVDMIFIKHKPDADKQEFYLKGHDEADGSGGLMQAMTQFDNYSSCPLPTVKSEKRPPLFKRWYLAYKHLKRQKPVHYPWKQFDSNNKGAAAGLSYAIFSKEETNALEQYCRENNTNLNSLLIWAIDRVTAEKFLKDKNFDSRVWMVPVNIRKKDQATNLSGNYVTTLSVKMHQDTPQSIHQQVRSMMRSGIIWGGEIIANAPKYIGEKRLRKMSKNIKSPYFGLCSNLGSWPLNGQTGSSTAHWLAASPVTRFCPVASVVGKSNDALWTTLLFHPSISSHKSDTHNAIEKWIDLLSRETGIALSAKLVVIDWKDMMAKAKRF